jgi:zinc transporter 2
VIGALSSILIIWVLTIWLITEAIDRIFHPREIIGLVMMGIATCGLIFNIIMSQVLAYNPVPNAMEGKGIKDYNENEIQEDLQSPLLEGEEYNENEKNKTDANPVIRAAYIHIIGDMIQSLGVLIAAVTIYLLQDTHPGIRIFDPICTFIFAIIVLCTTIPVSSDCLNVLMEAAPKNIDIKRLYYELQKVVGVVNVHDIHIWNISIGRPSISLHILSDLPQKTLEQATLLCKKYGIHHCTIQVEDNTQIKRLSFIACDHEHENDIH